MTGRRKLVAAAAFGLPFLVTPLVASGLGFYRTSLPTTVRDRTPTGALVDCRTCHLGAGGGAACADRPCLNPFGGDFAAELFGTGGFDWSDLAALDSDGDGFSNGVELQDLMEDWVEGEPAPGVPGNATNPGFPDEHPGVDADGDGFCVVGRDSNGDGECAGAEITVSAFDCDDTQRDANSGVLTEDCTNIRDNDCDGIAPRDEDECLPFVDRDGDGFCPEGVDLDGDGTCIGPDESLEELRDCDDDDPTVYLDAAEDCFDGVDDDCDGDVDEATFCSGSMDRDGDGFCPRGRDMNGDGNCTETAGTATRANSDCNDLEASANPNAAEVCTDGLDTDCDGELDATDLDCVGYADVDGDGWCPVGRDANADGDCFDAMEAMGPGDCDDDAPEVNPGALEDCTPACGAAVDDDCDGDADADDADCARFVDADGDGWCPTGLDTVTHVPCGGRPPAEPDGLCVSGGELREEGDCNDRAAEETPDGVECDPSGTPCLCTDGFDNDCNGRRDARDPICVDYVDADGDGWCVIGRDMDGDRECTGPGEQGGEGDAAPLDPVIFPGAPEHCLDGKDNDQDGAADAADVDCSNAVDADDDGYCPIGRDADGNGSCADPGEDQTVSDCDDGDAEVNPGRTESSRALCTDFRDNDCDLAIDLGDEVNGLYEADEDCDVLRDLDGDGVCAEGVDWNDDGDCTDADEENGFDCDETDPLVHQGTPERCGNGKDDNCNGETDEFGCLCPADQPDCDVFVPERTAGCRAAPGAAAPFGALILGFATVALLWRRRRTR